MTIKNAQSFFRDRQSFNQSIIQTFPSFCFFHSHVKKTCRKRRPGVTMPSTENNRDDGLAETNEDRNDNAKMAKFKYVIHIEACFLILLMIDFLVSHLITIDCILFVPSMSSVSLRIFLCQTILQRSF